MDFLDPKKKRAHDRRLAIGYILVAIVILLATKILVYAVSGYGIDTKTGQIVQNGLLFVDSQPGNAEVYLNGVDRHTTTSARLNLQAGKYDLKLTKDGYRDWSRSFDLAEQSIARYIYPLLIPQKPVTTTLKPYAAQPALITQSPDQKWLLVFNNSASDKTVVFDEYDTTTLDDATPKTATVTLPADLLTNYSPVSVIKEIEWSTDNNNVLLQHSYDGGSEFIVFNRDKPEESFNVNRTFTAAPYQVSLYDNKVDKLYLLSAPNGSLQLGVVKDKTLGLPMLKNVLSYKPYGKNLVAFVTASKTEGNVTAKIWDNKKTYTLNEFSAGDAYLIDLAEFQGHFYYVDGSNTSDRFNVYKDPLDGLKDPSKAKATAAVSLHNPGATKLKFSDNTRFIGTENGQQFAVYDIETQSSYQYVLTDPLSGDMDWMDGHRYIGLSEGNILIMDYDGINKQIVAPSSLSQGTFFDKDYKHLLTVNSDSAGAIGLRDIDMRAGTDLPKSKQ